LDSFPVNCDAVSDKHDVFTRTSHWWRTFTRANGVLPF
jgi:hypothetical protein